MLPIERRNIRRSSAHYYYDQSGSIGNFQLFRSEQLLRVIRRRNLSSLEEIGVGWTSGGMRFFSKRKLLENLQRDRWRNLVRVPSTASVKKFKRSERVRSRTVKTTTSSRRGTEMGAEDVTGKTLPEELVEKIIAMMPYPSIFKAQLLSKAWLARFKPISFLETEKEKRVAISFQKMVAERSISWDTFSPVCLMEPTQPVNKSIVFNHATQNWQNLPPRSFLDYNIFPTEFPTGFRHPEFSSDPRDPEYFLDHMHHECYEGPFVYGEVYFERRVYVGNILTREWRLLPALPNTEVLCKKLVIDTVLGTYKLILLCQTDSELSDEEDYKCFLQIYDSKLGTWNSKVCIPYGYNPDVTDGPDWAVLNGVLYIVSSINMNCLWAFNLAKWTWEELRLSFRDAEVIYDAKLVTCSDNLVMIATKIMTESISVYDIDLASLQLSEVAQRSAIVERDVMHTPEMIKACFSEADCLFFKMPFCEYEKEGQVAKYNTHKDQWSFCDVCKCRYEWNNCSFEPGLNPFMAV